MSDVACGFLKSYLSEQWDKANPDGNGLPLISRILLHLTVSRYGDVLFAGLQKPHRKSDVIQTPVLMLLYNLTQATEATVAGYAVMISELLMAACVLGVMFVLSYFINVTVVFGLYMGLTAVALRFRKPVSDDIKKFIASRSYSVLLYNIHLR